jgi:hypothetical protein
MPTLQRNTEDKLDAYFQSDGVWVGVEVGVKIPDVKRIEATHVSGIHTLPLFASTVVPRGRIELPTPTFSV